jgi:preprotein translocase subunit SecD
MIWRRFLILVGLITTTVALAASLPAQAAVGIHRVTYRTIAPATTAQLKAVGRILTRRLDRLGASFVHVTVSHDDVIILSSASRAISESFLNEVGQTDQLYFRPVLCFAPPLVIPAPSNGQTAARPLSGAAPLPSCGSTYATDASNLAVTPNSSVQGYSSNSPSPEPMFAQYTSTNTNVANYEHRTVLLPSLPGSSTTLNTSLRYVLGPAEMTGASIGSAVAQQSQTGAWEVNYSLKGSAGSQLWDKVADENFHLLLGIELDGVVQSAPLIQPTQDSFTSFDGQGTISGGNMTEADAKSLALAMQFGSLPVRLLELETCSGQRACFG